MRNYSLLLEIAGLSVKFYCKQKTDATFLKKRYADYAIEKEEVKKPACEIFFPYHGSRQIQAKGVKFYIPALLLRSKFRRFNDFLRVILMYVLSRNKGFILHASSLVKNDFGYIFIGKEDAGKSTIRKLFPEFVCLGDDSALVRKVRGQYFLFGSPFYQRTYRAYRNRKVPIKGVFELKRANFNLIKLLPFPENVKAISSNSFITNLGRKGQEKELLLKNSFDYCLRNKVFSLSFEKSRFFWSLLRLANSKNLLDKKTDKIAKQINPRVLKKLPQGVVWSPAVASWGFLGKCLVINEASWNFEFGGQRRVRKIARIISQPNFISSHVKLINTTKKQMTKKVNKRWIILIEQNNGFTIIDGNHLAIAAYLLGKKGRNLNLRFLIGKLPQAKTCIWC